mgnify:CR=1 FL=1
MGLGLHISLFARRDIPGMFARRRKSSAPRTSRHTPVIAVLAAVLAATLSTVSPAPVAAATVPDITVPIALDHLDQVRWTDTWGAPRSGGRSHVGVDMLGPKMTPMVAAADGVIRSVPFAFIDSFAESASIAQGPMTTWESLLRGLVAAARDRGVDHDVEMAGVVDELADAATLERVVAQVPPELDGVDPTRLGDPEVMSAAAMRSWIESL